MHTRALKTLSRIAQVQSFQVAAAQLNMTLSAVSMQMKKLERDLDAQLFDRSCRPPVLTPLGRALARQADTVLEAEEAMVALCQTDIPMAGRFRFGFVPTAAVRILPGFLRQAQTAFPMAEFEIETGLSEDLEARVAARQLDAAVLTLFGAPRAELCATQAAQEEMVIAHHSALWQGDVRRTLAGSPFLQFDPRSGIGKLIAREMVHLRPHSDKPILVLDSVEAIMECINQGLGATLLTKADVARYATAQIQSHPVGAAPLTRALVLVTRTADTLAQKAQDLAALMRP